MWAYAPLAPYVGMPMGWDDVAVSRGRGRSSSKNVVKSVSVGGCGTLPLHVNN